MLKHRQATREQLAALRPELTPDNELAIELWNAMAGQIAWAALPILFGMYRIVDPAAMLDRLRVLQDEAASPEPTPGGAAT